MLKETRIIEKYCDICRKQVEDFVTTSETNGVVFEIIKYVWYGTPEHKKEICSSCNRAIYQLIESLSKGESK